MVDHPGLRHASPTLRPSSSASSTPTPTTRGPISSNSGQGNVQIDATNLATGQTTSVQTWSTGGYQLALAPGRYQVTASQNNTVIQTTQVSIGSDNVEQDFLVTGAWDGRTRDQVVASLAPQPAAPAPVAMAAPAAAPAPVVATPAPVAPAPVATPKAAAPIAPVSIDPVPVSTSNPTSMGSWTSWKANTV